MNPDLPLQIQAWLDGELPPAQAAQLARAVETDPAARGLRDELLATRTVLRAHEPVRAVPESREFYWSKIERELRRLEAAPAPAASRPARMDWLLKYLVPAGAAALLALLFLSPALTGRVLGPGRDLAAAEIETPLQNVSSFTFRSEAENMTVVWISLR